MPMGISPRLYHVFIAQIAPAPLGCASLKLMARISTSPLSASACSTANAPTSSTSVDMSVSNITFFGFISSVPSASKLDGVVIKVRNVNIVTRYETFKCLSRRKEGLSPTLRFDIVRFQGKSFLRTEMPPSLNNFAVDFGFILIVNSTAGIKPSNNPTDTLNERNPIAKIQV